MDTYNSTGIDTSNSTTGNTTTPFTYNFTPTPELYFGYSPNKTLEIVVLALFTAFTLGVLVQSIWKKTWFMIPLVLGGILEMAGFGGMIYATNTFSINAYIINLLGVLVAPTVLAAADYGLAGHIMQRGKVRVACFTPKVTKYSFLGIDIIAFFTQAIGAVIVGNAKTIEDIQKGAYIILLGLAISLFVFTVFLIFSIVLRKRILAKARKNGADTTRILWVVYMNMLFLVIRAFYRIVEFKEKLSTPPQNDLGGEGYYYGLDIMLMVLLMLSWVIFHPYRFGMHNWRKEETLDSELTEPKKIDIRGV